MKRPLLILLMACAALSVGAQKIKFPGGPCQMWRVYLRDKVGTPFSLAHPQDFLSSKALARRSRQGLGVDSTDLPVSPHYVSQVETHGFEVVGSSKWNNTLLVRARDAKTPKELETLSFVKQVKKVFTAPDSIKRPVRHTFQNDMNYWNRADDTTHGVAYAQIKMLSGQQLHYAGWRGAGMTIAVFDGGFMNVDRIPAFKSVKILGTRDFVSPPSESVFKELDHGTKVLSCMATNVEGRFVGTAPEASFWLLRCEDNQTETPAEEDYWAMAAEFADSVGVDIVSSSLGFQDFDEPWMNHTYDEQDGHHALISRTASMMASKGMVLVNSAGNDGMGTWKKINFPADADDMLAVGAVNLQRVNAVFSSVGPSADGRVKPDVMALGSPAMLINGRGAITQDMGTSFSTPIVAGLVACLWQALPTKTAKEIVELVRQSGDAAAHPNNVMGYGIPDFWKAWQMGKNN